MAAAAMAPLLLDASRFVHAWQRFRAHSSGGESDDTAARLLQQFHDMALAFHKTAQDNQSDVEWSKLQGALKTVVDETSRVCSAAPSLQSSSVSLTRDSAPFHLPRTADLLLLKTKKQQQRRVSTPSSPPSPARRDSSSERHVQSLAPPQERSPRHSIAPPPTTTTKATTELRAEDLRSMLEPKPAREEKLSISALRQRIGLTDRSSATAQATASETAVREEQEAIQSDMISLARELKQRTQAVNESLVADVKILDAVGQSAESNATLLEREHAVLKKQLASAIGLWTSLALIGAVVLVFLVTYFYIKLFSRRRW